MVEISQLEFAYPTSQFCLRVDHFVVQRGEKVALIGPSGSGKSTLLNLIAGVHRPDRGTVCVDGCHLAELGESARGRFRLANVGMVFQSFELLDHLTVRENMLLPYRLDPSLRRTAEVDRRVDELCEQLELAAKRKRYADKLSQGERQRVAIGRALITQPKLILADEPTGNLDPANKQRVLDLLIAGAELHNASLIMVTHDHNLLDRFPTHYEVGPTEAAPSVTVITPLCGSTNDG
ncbi:MAG: ABC transporter ATP-binding protein [Planctomycetota bacterium]